MERVVANDNIRPAGTLRGRELRLRLDARVGMWRPDGKDAAGAAVPAFSEAGKPLQIPGPLVRVPAGTEIVMTVKNSVPGTVLTMHGLVSRPRPPASTPDSVAIASGASREVRFRLDAPGTYYYWGTTTGRAFRLRTGKDAQLSGAIVVDEPGAPRRRDRILVIGMWSDTTPSETTRDADQARLLLVVNGRSWPHTSRLAYTVGDSVRWRVINASADVHPMHLHGFYYHVDSRGDGTGRLDLRRRSAGHGRDRAAQPRQDDDDVVGAGAPRQLALSLPLHVALRRTRAIGPDARAGRRTHAGPACRESRTPGDERPRDRRARRAGTLGGRPARGGVRCRPAANPATGARRSRRLRGVAAL